MSAANPWAEVDAWSRKQWSRHSERNISLICLGWIAVATNDGTFAARRLRDSDEPGVIPQDGAEVSAPTWEQLYAEVQARAGKNGGAA